ncbi:LptA/OstA family protein [Deinococcus sp. MIMF12]|uniref:LptA/OstA family protein n=1 Tax=Deinococcus rhizophilus TaxID=3049544 RepID=A0ABT7JDE6_9DEIO|nr:LptA/OstA family protein [Deinococcus rhizophilus]MDL2343074.1 LptA/OstA family protein [Deinococcus rhizophilus]
MPRRPLLLTLTLLLGVALPAVTHAQETPPAAPPTGSPPAGPRTPAAPPETTELGDTAPPAGTETSSLELVRRGGDGQERRIRIVRTGTDDTTGVFVICSPLDDEPEGSPNVAVFSESGSGGVQITIDQNQIRVPLALVTQRPAAEGEGSDGRIEASAGTARFLDEVPEGQTDRLTRCGVEATPQPAPDTVLVTQGRTELRGQKLVYDETDGVARIDGPITFTRPGEDGPLTGQSERIEVEVDTEKTVLIGAVVLNSPDGRVSRAARVEYDDGANLARLIGSTEQPAESSLRGDVLRAGELLYDLERNEVVARAPEGGTITGEFQDGEETSAPTTAPRTP